MLRSVKLKLLGTTNRRVARLPVSVMTPPPSRMALVVRVMGLENAMVLGPPQLKVTRPPPARAVLTPAWVQFVTTPAPGAALFVPLSPAKTSTNAMSQRVSGGMVSVSRERKAEGRKQKLDAGSWKR